MGRAAPGTKLHVLITTIWHRVELAQFLVNEVRRLVPENVTYHFQHSCEAINFESHSLTLGHPNGDSLQVSDLPDFLNLKP